MAFNISLFSKFLQIGLAGLSAVPILEQEFGGSDHLGAINDSVQVAASLATAATSDTGTQSQIAAAAAAAPAVISAIAGIVAQIKAIVHAH